MILESIKGGANPDSIIIEQGEVGAFFALDDSLKAYFSYKPEPMTVMPGQCLTIFNAQKDTEFKLSGNSGYGLKIGFDQLHQSLGKDVGWTGQALAAQRYYNIENFHPMIREILNDWERVDLSPDFEQVFRKGKELELLALYMNGPASQPHASCPFLQGKGNYEKIVEAKQLLISKFKDPYTVADLARAIGANEHQLKTGFKEVYGTSVNKFFQQHRLQRAKDLLSEDVQINEVADELGYGSTSHFIDAFKKRYGTTPKKYQSQL
jgi:AraC-like DNA-binding protein